MVKCSTQGLVMDDFSQLRGSSHLYARYGLFNCHGGVSSGKYDSLNVGLHVGDAESSVYANREHVKTLMGASTLLSALQVHGNKIYVENTSCISDLEVDGYDALVTNQKGVALMVQHADCQGVLLYDSVSGVIAAVHNGWRGSVQNICAKVVRVMSREYLTNPKDVQAIIGPSLGPCCAEFLNYKTELPEKFVEFMLKENYFDFWKISIRPLVEAGLNNKNILTSGRCTRCSDDYFSYRKAVQAGDGVTGRNGSVIVLYER